MLSRRGAGPEQADAGHGADRRATAKVTTSV
jgi:hypothetical protein